MKKVKRCVECGSPTVFETRSDEVSYKGHTKTFETEAWWCQNEECGEAVLDGKALRHASQVWAELKATVEGLLSPVEIAEIRESLGLSQRAAGELLGGGPIAFHKYESGKASVSMPMSNLLRILRADPSQLEALRRARSA